MKNSSRFLNHAHLVVIEGHVTQIVVAQRQAQSHDRCQQQIRQRRTKSSFLHSRDPYFKIFSPAVRTKVKQTHCDKREYGSGKKLRLK